MGDINNSVGKMREYFKSKKAVSYKIEGHPLENGEDYVKYIYMEMLCVILQYGGIPKDEQTLFLQRLMEGTGVGDRFSEYMRKALQLDESFAEEFVNQFKNSELKYNFIVDSLILIGIVGKPEKQSAEFISEICEMFLLTKKDVDFLVHIALSILEQNSNIYNDISDKKTAQNKISYFMCYFKQFFTGKLIDTGSQIYYFAKEKVKLDLQDKEGVVEFKQDNVIIENYIIDFNEIDLEFIGCKCVEFTNCNFSGGGPITLKNCVDITVTDCKFTDFTNGVFDLDSCKNFTIIRSKFKRCGKVNYSSINGGIIYSKKLNNIDIKSCDFSNCFVKCGNTYDVICGYVFNGNDSTKCANVENNNFGYFNRVGITYGGLFYGISKEYVKSINNTILDNNIQLI